MQPCAPERLVLLGAGGLAKSLAWALTRVSQAVELVQIYSPSGVSARQLARELPVAVPVATTLEELVRDATWYVFAVRDDVLPTLATTLAPELGGIWLHTSGATSLETLSACHPLSGVLYPLQTFSRAKVVDFRTVPLYLEVADPAIAPKLEALAGALSPVLHWASSAQRLTLHLAGVLACNFSNHLIATAETLLAEASLPPKALLPLLDETLAKLHHLSAQQAQTGPALRGDELTLARHRAHLSSDPQLLALYDLLTTRIRAQGS